MGRWHPCLFLPAATALAAVAPVRAAESYDNCTGFVDSLPANIATQGTWCLRRDLSTAIASGAAITIATNNVTLDCNDFKLGGLAAGAGTQAVGILASNRHNATVRNCAVRGFRIGVQLVGDGHLVARNRFDNNTRVGISVEGDGSEVRSNRVLDTGGASEAGDAVGIETVGAADLLDNLVAGVVPTGTGASGYGIRAREAHGSLHGNRVRLILANDGGVPYAMDIRHSESTYRKFGLPSPSSPSQAICEPGSYLASIGSAEENQAVLAVAAGLPATQAVWLGGKRTVSFGSIGLGWASGEPWGYSNWSTGEPDYDGEGQTLYASYVAMATDGTWMDFKLAPAPVNGFICEQPVRAVSLRGNVLDGSIRCLNVYGMARDNRLGTNAFGICVDAGGNSP